MVICGGRKRVTYNQVISISIDNLYLKYILEKISKKISPRHNLTQNNTFFITFSAVLG